MKTPLYPILLWTVFLALSLPISAQREPVEVDLSSPYHTMLTHLHFLQEDNLDLSKASAVIDPSLPQSQRELAARRIKKLYDGQGLYVYLSKIPDATEYRDSLSGRQVFSPFADQLPAVYLEKYDSVWLYSHETIDRLEEEYKAAFPFGTHQLVDNFNIDSDRRFLGLHGWQYAGILVLLGILWLLFFLSAKIIFANALRLIRKYLDLSDRGVKNLRLATRLISLYLGILVFRLLVPILQLPIEFSQPLILILKVVSRFLWIIVWVRIIDLLGEYTMSLAGRTENKLDDQFIPILTKILKIIVFVIGIMSILRALDVNVTALIAGVSIGGLALALAAQDTVKNFLGSMMIFVDKPFQVEDYIITPDVEGTVLEVGFRTTRVRKVDTSVISVPNGQLINTPITNFGVRTARMYQTTVEMVYDTPTAKIKEMIDQLSSYLGSREWLNPENYIVRFTQMKDFSLSLMVRAYITAETYAEELQRREEINLHILELAEKLGIDLAFPTQTIHIESEKEDQKKEKSS